MPGLASYEKKMRSAGLLVLGVARQSKKDKALEVASKAGVEFAIINGGTLPETNANSFPTYVLYGRDGEIIQRQSGAHLPDGISPEMLTAIDKALAEVAAVLVVDAEAYREKPVAKLAKRISQGAQPGKLLPQLDELLASGGEDEKAEAARLREEILAYGLRMLDQAAKIKEESPHQHFDLMKDLAKQFQSHEIGDQANQFVESVKADRGLKDEIEASRLYETMQQAEDKKAIYKQIKKKYPDTRFGRQACQEMEP